MNLPLNFGGGAGNGSDDCTAEAKDVIENATAIYNGSDDEAEYGTMKDYSGQVVAATAGLDSSNRLRMTVASEGRYSTSSKLYDSYNNVASAIGLTASKIATGNTVLGMAGSYTGLGDATVDDVLASRTFSSSSLSGATGEMPDRSGTTSSATCSVSGSNVRLQIPSKGYYNTSAYLTTSYSNLASVIGLDASILKANESILGIAGNWNGYSSVSADLYNAGTVGSVAGSISTCPITNGTVSLDGSYITISRTSGSGTGCNGFVFNTSVNMAAYNTITVTYTVITTPASSNYDCSLYVTVYDTKPTSSSYLTPYVITGPGTIGSYALLNANETLYGKTTNTSYTLSFNIANLYPTGYLGICVDNTNGSSNYYYSVRITRIQIS